MKTRSSWTFCYKAHSAKNVALDPRIREKNRRVFQNHEFLHVCMYMYVCLHIYLFVCHNRSLLYDNSEINLQVPESTKLARTTKPLYQLKWKLIIHSSVSWAISQIEYTDLTAKNWFDQGSFTMYSQSPMILSKVYL